MFSPRKVHKVLNNAVTQSQTKTNGLNSQRTNAAVWFPATRLNCRQQHLQLFFCWKPEAPLRMSPFLQDLRLWKPSVRGWRYEVKMEVNCCSLQLRRRSSWQLKSSPSQVKCTLLSLTVCVQYAERSLVTQRAYEEHYRYRQRQITRGVLNSKFTGRFNADYPNNKLNTINFLWMCFIVRSLVCTNAVPWARGCDKCKRHPAASLE